MAEEQSPGFSTLAIHAGIASDPGAGMRATPIDQTGSAFDDVEQVADIFAPGDLQTRTVNPTVAALEERIAALEGGTAAIAVASGRAAQLIVLHALMRPGDELVVAGKRHSTSLDQLSHIMRNSGWKAVFVDADDTASIEAAISPRTKAIFAESMARSGGTVTDLEALAAIARRAAVPLIVDNALATPYLCRPFEFGADIVVHSLTRFLGGHANCTGGAIVDGGTFDWSREGRYPMLSEPRAEYDGVSLHEACGNFAFATACRVLGLRDLGQALSSFNALPILIGIETLPLRMQRHCENALAVARWLEEQREVSWVRYAGLPGDRYHNLAKRYGPKGAGAVLTFGVRGGYEAGVAVVEGVRVFSRLASIGDTRSSIFHVASMTDSRLHDGEQAQAGAGRDVIRLSIGLEDVEDIIADLKQALASAAN